MQKLLIVVLALLLASGGAAAQYDSATATVEVPFDMRIRLDGDLSDWQDIPFITVDEGLLLSDVAGERTAFDFALAAERDMLYVVVKVVDDNIISGQYAEAGDWWNEDSLEIYLNFSDNTTPDTYQDGVLQFVIPALNITNEREVNNDMVETHIVEGVSQVWELPPPAIVAGETGAITPIVAAFETENGWGIEMGIPLVDTFAVVDGAEMGFNIMANGTTATQDETTGLFVRDSKLAWVFPENTDNLDPLIFGVAQFVAQETG